MSSVCSAAKLTLDSTFVTCGRSSIELLIPFRVYHPSTVTNLMRLSPEANTVDHVITPHHLVHQAAPPMSSVYSGYPSAQPNFYPAVSTSPPTQPWVTSLRPDSPASPHHQFYFDAYPYTEAYHVPPLESSIDVQRLIMPSSDHPQRPLSAGLATQPSRSGLLDMPYGLPYPEHADTLKFSPTLPSDQIHAVHNLTQTLDAGMAGDDRASRISRHLRMTSRHRSVSPPRARQSLIVATQEPTPLAKQVPSQLSPDPATDLIQQSPSTPLSQHDPIAPKQTSTPLLSPRPINSPGRSYFDTRSDHGQIDRSSSSQRSPQVEELERIVSEPENPSTLSGTARQADSADNSQTKAGPQILEKQLEARIDKTLPRPPASISSTMARGLPGAAFGDSTLDSTAIHSAVSCAESAHQDKPPIIDAGGLTLLERRLGRPAAYEIFTAPSSTPSPPPLSHGVDLSKPGINTSPRERGTKFERQPKPSPEDKRLQAEARVTAWLHEDLGPEKNANSPALHEPRSITVDKAVQPLQKSSVSTGIPGDPTASRPSAIPKPTQDAAAALKSKPHVAISSGLVSLDWRTLDRVRLIGTSDLGFIDTNHRSSIEPS